jgi:hypothetical protein
LRKEKAEVVDHIGLRDRLDKFSALEHMNYLNDVLMPRVTKFSENIDLFTTKLGDMAIVVRSFDSAICQKCSKTDLTVLRQELEDSFITQTYWD